MKSGQKLSVVPSADRGPTPPRPLAEPGLSLWRRVTEAYAIEDAGGIEILAQACAALDRAEGCAAAIAADGAVVRSKTGVLREHPLMRAEAANRAAVVRFLRNLGLDVEPLRPTVGRPPGFC